MIPKAYVEELKISFEKFSKSIDTALRLGPEMEKFMDEAKISMQKRKPMVFLGGSIFASAIFIGSVLLYPTNEVFGMDYFWFDNDRFCNF